MNLFRPFFALLLAWLIAFEALAGVMGAGCRHAGQDGTGTEQPAAPMDHASMSPAEHAQHMQQMQAASGGDHAAHGAPKAAGCDCGCDCASQCALSCAGLVAAMPAAPTFEFSSFTLPAASVLTAAAHGLDLYRPPSIS